MKCLPRRVMKAAFHAASVCVALQGCTLLSPPKHAIERSVLNQLPTAIPHRDIGGGTVLVFPPATMPIYDTVLMAYRTDAREIAYFSQRQWGATPSQMIQPLIVTTLEKTHSFRVILVPPYVGPYTYSLRTEILDLVQDFTPKSPALVLSLRFQLAGYGASRVIATRDISVREPMLQSNSRSGVAAANEATAKALRQMAEFVLESAAPNAVPKSKP